MEETEEPQQRHHGGDFVQDQEGEDVGTRRQFEVCCVRAKASWEAGDYFVEG